MSKQTDPTREQTRSERRVFENAVEACAHAASIRHVTAT